jgi:hypothetical protein
MPVYCCPNCNKEFNKKSTYNDHIYHRKNKCGDKQIKNPIKKGKQKSEKQFHKTNDGLFECPKCHNTYITKGNAKRHYYKLCIHSNTASRTEKLTDNDICIRDGKDNDDGEIHQDDKTIADQKDIRHTFSTTCEHCKKEFSRKDSLLRHQTNGCNVKIKLDNERSISNRKFIDEFDKRMESKCDSLKNIILEIQQQNDELHNNVVELIEFNRENLYKLIDEDLVKKYLLKGHKAVYDLIEDIHFNPDRPEFHNVYMYHISHQYAVAYTDNELKKVNVDDVINELFHKKLDFLNAMYKKLKYTLDQKIVTRYSVLKNEKDDAVIDIIKENIKTLLYTKQYIPVETIKQCGLL